jgi:hypothetical protein
MGIGGEEVKRGGSSWGRRLTLQVEGVVQAQLMLDRYKPNSVWCRAVLKWAMPHAVYMTQPI